MEQINPCTTAATPTPQANSLPRTLPPEALQAIIDSAVEIWENTNRDEIEIGSPDDPCCGSNTGDIENMISRGIRGNGTWIRAWVWVQDDEVKALESPHIMGWTDADAAAAVAQGWNIGQLSEGIAYHIQRDNETETFKSDKEAIKWVQGLAQQGSTLHQKALAIHESFKSLEEDSDESKNWRHR